MLDVLGSALMISPAVLLKAGYISQNWRVRDTPPILGRSLSRGTLVASN
jgi:hypothetical protein